MKFCMLKNYSGGFPFICLNDKFLQLKDMEELMGIRTPDTLDDMIRNSGVVDNLRHIDYNRGKVSNLHKLEKNEAEYAIPISHPGKIWSIGLNYIEHARYLNVKQPVMPASFMKPKTSMITQGENIVIPKGWGRITAEAELGIIIGKKGKNISEEDAISHVFGITPIIDMTALDILEQNPRFLTLSKSFDTFFSIGPEIATIDDFPDLHTLKISTIKNGRIEHANIVKNMMFSPEKLISFHSKIFTLEPGDIISTGTPGAVEIQSGDKVRCIIEGKNSLSLENNVI